MSKIIRTRKPSVLPYYAAALVFVVLCAVLPVYRLWALAAALALTSALPERAFVGEYERLFGTVSDEAAEPEKAS